MLFCFFVKILNYLKTLFLTFLKKLLVNFFWLFKWQENINYLNFVVFIFPSFLEAASLTHLELTGELASNWAEGCSGESG